MAQTGKPGCPNCQGRGGKHIWINGKLRWIKCIVCFPPMTPQRKAWLRYANSIGAKNPAPHPDTKKQGRLFS